MRFKNWKTKLIVYVSLLLALYLYYQMDRTQDEQIFVTVGLFALLLLILLVWVTLRLGLHKKHTVPGARLITCTDCQKEYSMDAKRCIHCGAQKPITKADIGYTAFVLGAAAIYLLLPADKPLSTKVDEPPSHDVDNLYSIGKQLQAKGAITTYEVSGWHHRLDLNIGSLSPIEASSFAYSICEQAINSFQWTNTWKIRVFLIVGDKPAAQCDVF